MKHLKLFESFEIGMGAHNVASDFGLTIEDIEDLFIEFSDMGYTVKIMKSTAIYLKKKDILLVDIKGIGDKKLDPEFKRIKEKVISDAKKLGLNMLENPKWENQFMKKSDLRFTFNKI